MAARLSDALVYRTDLHGTVRISPDGERLWVEPQRTRSAALGVASFALLVFLAGRPIDSQVRILPGAPTLY